MEFVHKSVLLKETIDGLKIKPDGIYVDGTLGGGGHASEVARRLSDKGSIIGIDQDAAAIEAAGIRLKDFGEKVTIVRSNYCDMKSQLGKLGIDKVDGIVLDLGVSSYQLDTAERGFSYREDAPLDMRMDRRQKMTARDIVNDYELNQELEVLKNSLDAMIDLLNPGGRLCIITFHSLEDRIVKSAFRKNENPCTCPSDFPVCVCGKISKGSIITRKPILPSKEEMEENSRAKSAKLRIFERS